jgi:hypothetical protein
LQYAFSRERDTLLGPGRRLVLVRDLFRFQRVYGFETPVVGIYSGQLSRSGEEIALATGSNIVAGVNYGFLPPWPSMGDDSNLSLVLAHPERGQNNPAAWRLSSVPNGTPGDTDSVSFVGETGADLDGDGFPAVVEYALGTRDTDAASGPDDLQATLDTFGQLTLSFPRRLAADDLILQCESSHDLVLWFPATLVRSDYTGSGLARETWGAAGAGQRALFLRLTVRPSRSM